MQMKQILLVSGIQIFPPESGGQLRSANLCRSLVKLGHHVKIYSFTGRKEDYLKHLGSTENKIQENLYEHVNRSSLFGLIQLFFYRMNLPPLWLTWLTLFYIPQELRQKIKECDTVISDFPYLYPIAHSSQKHFLLNTHNAEFELYLDKPKLSKTIRNLELKSFHIAERIFFCSPNELKKYFDILDGEYFTLSSKSLLLPNGIDLFDFQFDNKMRTTARNELNISKNKNVFLFTGSHFPPNVEAFNFLQHWCSINREAILKLNILILVVGTVCTNKIDQEHFKVLGGVKNTKPYFSASDFGLNLVNFGSGTNVKMIEFLASKLPILSTQFGARGLKLTDNQTYWSFEREHLLEAIEKTISHSVEQRQEMARQALQENIINVDMFRSLELLNIEV